MKVSIVILALTGLVAALNSTSKPLSPVSPSLLSLSCPLILQLAYHSISLQYCKQDSDCLAGSTCMQFYPNTPALCVIKKGSCRGDIECNGLNSEQCEQGTCYAFKGQKRFGEKCKYLPQCGDKLGCDELGTKTCKHIDTCDENSKVDQCLGKSKCFGGSCRGPGKQGQECRGTLDCGGALVCYNHKCAERTYLKPGEKCSSFIECGSAICEDGICGEPAHGRCTNDADCPSPLWCYPSAGGRNNCCPQGTSRDDPCRNR